MSLKEYKALSPAERLAAWEAYKKAFKAKQKSC